MNVRAGLLVLWLTVCVGSFSGCGGGGTAQEVASPHPATSNLAGNWLLAGSLPTGPAVPIASTQLSVTFATVGDQLVGGGHAWTVCPATSGSIVGSGGAIGFGFVVSGQVTSDGDFVTQSQTPSAGGVALPVVNISGHVPSTAGGTWTGSYVIDTRQVQTSCPVMVGDATNAALIAPVTGTYKAAGTVTSGATKTPITMTMVLQQGASSTDANGNVVNQAYALNGTVTVDGTPCFHTGTLRSITPVGTTGLAGIGATVFGAQGLPQFTMDDGSLLLMPLYVANTSASQLDANGFGVSAGSCASSLTQQFQVGDFVRQP